MAPMTLFLLLLAIMGGRGCTAFHASNAINSNAIHISLGAGASSYYDSSPPYRAAVREGRPTIPTMALSASNNNGDTNADDEIERLRETASKLRAEAQEAEKALEGTRSTSTAGREGAAYVKPVEYTDLRDSLCMS